jgi:hypothetical protein
MTMLNATDKIHMRPSPPLATCEIHDWPTEGLGRRLVATMRERHGKGGVNVCRDCVTRARGDAKAEVSQRMSIVPLEEVRAGDLATFEHPAHAYGGGYKVEKVGPKNLNVSCDVRFAPDGPWHHQEHKIPRAHLKEVFRLEPIECAAVEKQDNEKTGLR